MDDIGRKLKSIDWARLQRQAKKVQASTASALKDLVMTDLENKVRAATADTSWGASSSDLMEIAQGTFHREDYALIMSIVWQRLGSSRWRCVYKTLEVLRYLIMHGSARCLEEACAAQHHLQTLEHYRCIDPDTRKDEGENVRARAAIVVAMISNPAILDEERQKDRALRAKLSSGASVHGPSSHAGGFSSDDYNYNRHSYAPSGRNPGLSDSSFDYRGGYDGAGVMSRHNVEARGSLSTRSDSGGYDDVPRGKLSAIGKRVSASSSQDNTSQGVLVNQSIDDLLGGDSKPGTLSTATDRIAVDDDDSFDPRAFAIGATTKPATLQNLDSASDVLSTLKINDDNSSLPPAAGVDRQSSDIPLSLRVQNLARQSASHQRTDLAAGHLSARNRVTVDSSASRPVPDVHLGNAELFCHTVEEVHVASGSSFAADGTHHGPSESGTSTPSSGPTSGSKSSEPTIVRKEVDPFADLVMAVKKTGV